MRGRQAPIRQHPALKFAVSGCRGPIRGFRVLLVPRPLHRSDKGNAKSCGIDFPAVFALRSGVEAPARRGRNLAEGEAYAARPGGPVVPDRRAGRGEIVDIRPGPSGRRSGRFGPSGGARERRGAPACRAGSPPSSLSQSTVESGRAAARIWSKVRRARLCESPNRDPLPREGWQSAGSDPGATAAGPAASPGRRHAVPPHLHRNRGSARASGAKARAAGIRSARFRAAPLLWRSPPGAARSRPCTLR